MVSLTGTIKKAVVELLVLRLLKEKDRYGYELTHELRRRSQGKISLLEGSMYPILRRLTENGCIRRYDNVEEGGGRPRVYYHLTAAGETLYEAQLAEYNDAVQMIRRILDGGEEGENNAKE